MALANAIRNENQENKSQIEINSQRDQKSIMSIGKLVIVGECLLGEEEDVSRIYNNTQISLNQTKGDQES